MKRILALVLCTLMTVALLAGCGSKKNDDTNTDKTWVVATDTTFRPFEYTDKDGNSITLKARGRHDPCVLPRAVPIVEAMAAMVILDAYLLNKTTHL